ncbi:MAG: FAD-dependent oxidoreductase [Candidatus Omnitrophica bacterium]|nr:FAD-dependent oxidoreductase [Candidatus Omnitrophota bacterium]
MPRKRIIIAGGGLAGLSCAWHLQRSNIDCHIFEKEKEPGGLCRSKDINSFTFDYDGHLLHFRHAYAFNLIKGLLGKNLAEHQRSAWICSFGRYTRYPFQANLYGLPLPIIKECLVGFIRASKNGKHSAGKDGDFLSWINNTFGRGIARYFMVPYNSKFWTLPPQKITCAWLDGFIPVPSLQEVVDGTIEENKRQFGYSAQFWYPKKGGVSLVPLSLAASIKNIHTQREITGIDIYNRQVEIAFRHREKYDYLITTLPLPQMVSLIKEIPFKVKRLFGKLKWNSIFNLNLGIEKKDYSGRHWIYFPQKEFCFFRVGFFHNFSDYVCPEGKSALYAEVSYSKQKPIDKKMIVSKIRKDLDEAGILAAKDRVCAEDVNDIEYGYPIYDKNYQRARSEIIEYLRQYDIFTCGRYGSWKYMSMEDALLDGKNVAERQIAPLIC